MKVQAVPTVFADGEQIHVGRSSMGDLLEKLEARYGSEMCIRDRWRMDMPIWL